MVSQSFCSWALSAERIQAHSPPFQKCHQEAEIITLPFLPEHTIPRSSYSLHGLVFFSFYKDLLHDE